jgi:hypothetical protein
MAKHAGRSMWNLVRDCRIQESASLLNNTFIRVKSLGYRSLTTRCEGLTNLTSTAQVGGVLQITL